MDLVLIIESTVVVCTPKPAAVKDVNLKAEEVFGVRAKIYDDIINVY